MSTAIPVAEQFDQLRRRARLSVAALAEALEYRSASGVQRFLKADDYKQPYLPRKHAENAVKALVGQGDPPITADEVWPLFGIEAPSTATAPVLAANARLANLLDMLADVDQRSVRALRDFVLGDETALTRLEGLEKEAEHLRSDVREKVRRQA